MSEDEKRLKKTFSPRAKIINFLYKFILRINTILRRNGDALIAPLTHHWRLHILKRIFRLLIIDCQQLADLVFFTSIGDLLRKGAKTVSQPRHATKGLRSLLSKNDWLNYDPNNG